MKKKVFWTVLMVSILSVLASVVVSAKTYGGEFNSGTNDPNGKPYTCVWIFDETSETLYIEGMGVIPDMTTQPWAEHKGNVKNLVIEEGITSIGKSNFSGHTSLKNITFPETLTNITMRAFEYCTSLEEVTISQNITNIGDKVFTGCTSLKKVVFGESLDNIGCNMFNGCTSLEAVYVYGENTVISRFRSNQEDGVLFKGCDFSKLTAYCLEDSDADDYFSNDIYTITNWSSNKFTGEETDQTFAKEQNYMEKNGYRLKVEYITE